ncbi:MAG TPA: FAD:protein FMN transferase, partial [Thermoanaerobaculia bacterium]|nr:FAD:protein FMN transferase [Thermoanaerobaculia bacterium]
RGTALAASEAALLAVAAAEARLSTWREDSELALLLAAPAGVPRALSPRLAEDLAAAERCWRETDGAFDPTVGALTAAWGLRTGGREDGGAPPRDELARALAVTGMDHVRLELFSEGPGQLRRLAAGVVIDEGGFGKGAGLRDALAAAEEAGATGVVLDFGGQVALSGEEVRRVPVADPRQRGRAAVVLALEGGSLATSGNGERGIVAGGVPRGHLLDPASGEPVADFGTLAVWTADPLRADCLSTGLYVLGPDAALAWAAEHPGVEVLVLESAGEGSGDGLRARATQGMAARVAAWADGVEWVEEEGLAWSPVPAAVAEADEEPGRRSLIGQEHGPAAPPNPAPRGGARSEGQYR